MNRQDEIRKQIGDLERLEKSLNAALAVALATLVAYVAALVALCASAIRGWP